MHVDFEVILISFADFCFHRLSTLTCRAVAFLTRRSFSGGGSEGGTLNYQPVAIARSPANFFLLTFSFCFSYALRPQPAGLKCRKPRVEYHMF